MVPLLTLEEALSHLAAEPLAPKVRLTDRLSAFPRGTLVRVTALITGHAAEYVTLTDRLVEYPQGEGLLVQGSLSHMARIIPVNEHGRFEAGAHCDSCSTFVSHAEYRGPPGHHLCTECS